LSVYVAKVSRSSSRAVERMREAISPLDKETVGSDLVALLVFSLDVLADRVTYLLTTRSRFRGLGGVVVDIVAVVIDGLKV
jgi:hypothetical protein